MLRVSLIALGLVGWIAACDSDAPTSLTTTSVSGSGGATQASASNASSSGSTTSSGGSGGAVDPGPNVDTSNPQLYETQFTADQADPAATEVLATQLAYLDTRVQPLGILVVYLHGAGAPSTCGSTAHGTLLAGLGFHVLSPCYNSDYGVGNCGDDIEGCRLEAFEGVDHHAFVNITPPNSIETRVTMGLAYVQTQNPEGDWTYFVDGDAPKWSKIIISGISHGASSSGVIGLHRVVNRVVMLSGPYDVGQAWLQKPTLTPIDRFFGFSHTADGQHSGHLQAFADMGLPGQPTSVDGANAPYGGSHRLISSAATSNGHGSTQAGGPSPIDGNGDYLFQSVWQTMYTGPL